MVINRGEIYFANLDPTIGGEIKKTRPVVVISNDTNNKYSSTVTVVPLTSQVSRVYPFEVFIKKDVANLPKDSKVKVDQIRTIDKQRLIKLTGILSGTLINQIEKAIRIHLDL